VDLVAKLLPYLQSTDKDTQKQAYLTIKALGDTKLMTTLALNDSGPAAQAALLSVAQSPESTKTDQQLAYQALTQIQSLVEVGKSVLRIQSGSGQTRATGFVWREPNLVVTALHAVLNADHLIVSSASESYPAEVYKVLATADLALLKSSQPFRETPLQEDDSSASFQGDASVLGYPFGVQKAMSSTVHIGTPRSLRHSMPADLLNKDQKAPIQNSNVDVLTLEGATAPGESGAPVINARGRVVGILVHGEPSGGAPQFSWAVPAARLQDLLNSSDRLPEAK
jgi:S1-C subfamily serine protease